MSFLNSPQYASVTTRLLAIMDDRMPRRHQAILAALIVFLTVASIAGSVSSRPTPAVVQPTPQVIILIATPSPPASEGLAKRAARIAPALAPTAAPQPTAEQQIQIVVVQPTVTALPPTVEPLPSPMGPTGNPPRWTIR